MPVRCCVLLILLCQCHPASAQSKIAVAIHQSGDDLVGKAVAYEVREAVSRSARYALVEEDAAWFVVRIVSIDESDEHPGHSSSMAVIYTAANMLPLDKTNPQTVLPIYVSGSVFQSGSSKSAKTATDIVAEFDSLLQTYQGRGGKVR
jgi:hypothetical protein